jgi:hypothetical protein
MVSRNLRMSFSYKGYGPAKCEKYWSLFEFEFVTGGFSMKRAILKLYRGILGNFMNALLVSIVVIHKNVFSIH